MTDAVANSTLGEIPWQETDNRENNTLKSERKTKGHIKALQGMPIYGRKSSICSRVEENNKQTAEKQKDSSDV